MAFCNPTQSCSGSVCSKDTTLRWAGVVKDINGIIEGPDGVLAFLDDVSVFGVDQLSHVRTDRSVFDRLRRHTAKFSSSKVMVCAMDAELLLSHHLAS